MDGTLLYTLEDIADSMNNVLAHFKMPTLPLHVYNNVVGSGARDHVKLALEKSSSKAVTESLVDEAFILYKEQYRNNWHNKSRLYDGIAQLLSTLELRGVNMGVLSNKPHIFLQQVMDHYFSKWHFQVALGAQEDCPRKPDPFLLNQIIEKNRFKKEETLFVGDSAIDINTAINAGVSSCGCLWGFRDFQELKDANANFIISMPLELENFVS